MKLSERVKRLEEKIEKLEGNWLEGGWTKIGDLEWSENLGQMDWFEAKKKCESLGGRLPTRIELLDLYDSHYDECKKLDDGFFWSATELSFNTSYAWSVHLHYGSTNFNLKSYSYDVRCVRRAKGDKG